RGIEERGRGDRGRRWVDRLVKEGNRSSGGRGLGSPPRRAASVRHGGPREKAPAVSGCFKCLGLDEGPVGRRARTFWHVVCQGSSKWYRRRSSSRRISIGVHSARPKSSKSAFGSRSGRWSSIVWGPTSRCLESTPQFLKRALPATDRAFLNCSICSQVARSSAWRSSR